MDRALAHVPAGVGLVGLIVLTGLVYSGSLGWGYLYEDGRMPQQWDGGMRAWAAHAMGAPQRSLTTAVWHLVGESTDYDPRWQRAASLGLHLLAAVLVWGLTRRVQRAAALVATGLFLLHPLNIEAVATVAYRSEVLVGLSLLVALACAERGWWAGAWLAAAIGMAAKEAGVMAFGLVPLWAWWRRQPIPWTLWGLACWPVLLFGLVWLGEQRLPWASLTQMTATAGAWTWLLGQWVAPIGVTMDPDWTVRLTPVVLGGMGLAWSAALGSRTGRLVCGWSVIALAPRLLWQTGEGLHSHHVYATTVILSLLTGMGVAGRSA